MIFKIKVFWKSNNENWKIRETFNFFFVRKQNGGMESNTLKLQLQELKNVERKPRLALACLCFFVGLFVCY